MTKRRAPLDWRPILLEACLVVLGVVLALAANEWRRAHNDRASAAAAMASIREELATNRTAVLESARYHIQLSDSLIALRNGAPGPAGPRTADISVFSRGFVLPARLLHTAWDAAEATGAVRHMGLDDVLLLSRVYDEQDYYRRQTDQVGQLIFGRIFDQGMQGMVANSPNLVNIISAFWYRECQLLQSYARVPGVVDDGDGQADLPERCRAMAAR